MKIRIVNALTQVRVTYITPGIKAGGFDCINVNPYPTLIGFVDPNKTGIFSVPSIIVAAVK